MSKRVRHLMQTMHSAQAHLNLVAHVELIRLVQNLVQVEPVVLAIHVP